MTFADGWALVECVLTGLPEELLVEPIELPPFLVAAALAHELR